MDVCEIGGMWYGKPSEVERALLTEKKMASGYETEAHLSSSDEEETDDEGEGKSDLTVETDTRVEWKTEPLGGGVLVELPAHHVTPCCQLELLDILKRNWQLAQMKLKKCEFLVSGIHEVKGTSGVRMPSNSIISMPVRIPKQDFRPDQLYNFNLHVEHNGVWFRRPAEYKNRHVKCRIDEFKSLCVTGSQKHERHVISPKGFRFESNADTSVTVDFPPGTIDRATVFTFTVDSVDTRRYSAYKKYHPVFFNCILGFSTTLHVQHADEVIINGKVHVSLPIHKTEEEVWSEEGEEGDVVFIRWADDGAAILEDTAMCGDVYTVAVNHFSGYSAVRKAKDANNQDVVAAARVLAGRENLCTILSFIRTRGLSSSVLLDVVESCRAEHVARRRRREGMTEIELSRSRDIPVSDRDRIHIELAGNLQHVPGVPKAVYNLTFVKSALTNHVTFPIQIRVTSTPYSVITFRECTGKWIHTIHFLTGPGFRSKNCLLASSTVTPYRPELKFRPVSDVPVTRVIFKQRTDDSQWEEHRPTTSQSAPAVCSGLEEDTLFLRPTSRTRPSSRARPVRSPSPAPSVAESESDVSARGHPALSEKSLHVLSEQLPLAEWNRVFLELELTSSTITDISEDAIKQSFSPSFKLLLHWSQLDPGKSGRDRLNELGSVFTDLDRTDLAEVIRRVGRTYKNFRRIDFKKIQ